MLGLWLCAWGVAHTTATHGCAQDPRLQCGGPDRLAWIVVLLVQSVPYASSLLVSLVSAFPLPARWLGLGYRPTERSRRHAEADSAT